MAKAQKVIKVEEDVVSHEDAVTASVEQMVADILKEVGEVDANGKKTKVGLTMEELEAKGLKNKSQVIRFLDSEGYTRSSIALFLNVRYQHVRNVLVTPLKRTA